MRSRAPRSSARLAPLFYTRERRMTPIRAHGSHLRNAACDAGHARDGGGGVREVLIVADAGLLGLGHEERLDEEKARAADEATIGDVEHGPVEPQVPVEEVTHSVEDETV